MFGPGPGHMYIGANFRVQLAFLGPYDIIAKEKLTKALSCVFLFLFFFQVL